MYPAIYPYLFLLTTSSLVRVDVRVYIINRPAEISLHLISSNSDTRMSTRLVMLDDVSATTGINVAMLATDLGSQNGIRAKTQQPV